MTNYTRVQIRRGAAANWAADNPILANGEQALETDTLQTKFGDGITHYNSLPYQDRQGPTGPTGPRGATGPVGAKGDTGSFGGAVFTYNYLTDTTDSNPGTGNLKFDNTLTTATHLFINKTDLTAVDNGPYLETIDDSTSSIKGHFKVEVVGNTDNFVYYAITGSHYLDESLYYEIPIMYLSGSITTLADNADVTITFVRTGDKGDKGDIGIASTVTLGTITTGDPGTSASISNSGDTHDAVFDFTIPQGPTGPTGPVGPTGPTVIDWHGPWNSGTTYSKNSIVSYSGKTYIATDTSYPPEDNTKTPITISTWQLFSSNGDKGDKGDTGSAATVSVGTVGTTSNNNPAQVSNVGTTSAAVLNFVIPAGPTGPIPTISVGTVSSTTYGNPAVVTNSGNSAGAVFNFTIPAGPTGPSGLKYSAIDSTSATSKTIGTSDTGHLVIMNNSSPITVTVNSSSLAADGEKVDFIQFGAGQISFNPSGVNLYSVGTRRKTTTQYSPVSLIRVTSTDYMLLGDLVA